MPIFVFSTKWQPWKWPYGSPEGSNQLEISLPIKVVLWLNTDFRHFKQSGNPESGHMATLRGQINIKFQSLSKLSYGKMLKSAFFLRYSNFVTTRRRRRRRTILSCYRPAPQVKKDYSLIKEQEKLCFKDLRQKCQKVKCQKVNHVSTVSATVNW